MTEAALFKSGDPVRYIPHYARGDPNHPCCENGIVASVNEEFVFVRYFARVKGIESGELRPHSQATDPGDLVKT